MQLYEVTGLPAVSDVPQVLAIGKFDGVHIGHQAILDEARHYLQPGTRFAVMCFEPHPSYVLTRDKTYLRSLTPRAEKVRILQDHGVDALYTIHFNEAYASTEAEAFVKSHLARLNLERIVVGQDFRFGRGGKGDVATLTAYASEIGIGVSVVGEVEQNGVKVSSSHIRNHLGEGRVEAAEALLGRPYSITGTVVHGDARGRLIGFPTANLGDIDQYVLPKPGVYAVSVEMSRSGVEHWFGVLNAGYRPTVAGQDYRLEVHLLGFNGDLYGETCRVSFLHRIRDERKFSGLDELKAQIQSDCRTAQDMLGLPAGTE
ncbi:bifunctional riboflavin kinase/FAD synthetase [Alicyclobacillus fastidiosus]|uniref:Riboflavin biosynthesis protein n=1 Tax=Alicyclobacillus fastidiosus TaxID=392011 RepID=A0ABV5AGR9_9BACL|nr:bifunctional riboflavin kinase/FAD synthetase [Alicyclobacillus fastidiosus]WEH07887.1 bifunctional riboflavin kinase/FAD synthetase [Alicyclobacillus fastidiosus]